MASMFLILPFLGPPFCTALLSNKCEVTEGVLQPHTSEPLSLCPSAVDIGLVAYCSNISSLPGDLAAIPKQVNALCLSGSTVLDEQAFVSFSELRYLSITLKMPVISLGAFLGLEKLKYLSIQSLGLGCSHSSIPMNAFVQLHQLQTLDIKGIDLTGQRGIMFPSQLQSLSVSRCCLENFSELFSIFPSLRWVPQVSVNNCAAARFPHSLPLKQHPDAPFSASGFQERTRFQPQMRNAIQSLSLSLFPLALGELMALEIEKLDSLSLVKTKQIEQDNESYRVCNLASRFSFRSLTFSQIDYKSFDSEELPGCFSVENLMLRENKMEHVDFWLLHKLPHLQLLDLSGNHLQWDLCPQANFTSKLHVLDFSGNRFRTLLSDTFSCLPSLERLSLNDCELDQIPVSALSSLHQLKVLNLRNNWFKKVASASFYNLSNLFSLDLRNNPIEYFGRAAFEGLASLRKLQIGSYDLNPTISFSMSRVAVFGLETDFVTFFNTPVATAFASVQNMTLCGCYNFEKDWEHAFFPKVQMLYWELAVHSCNSSEPFYHHFPQLEQLIYKYDVKESMLLSRRFNLSHLSKLQVLEVHNLPEDDLSSNPQEKQYFFMDVPHLETLRLVNSKIRYISGAFFKNKSKLRLLVLENEEFLALGDDIQDQLMGPVQLRNWHLSNVTFRCDCSSAWFIVWARRKKGIYVSGLQQAECLDVQLREKKFNFVSFIDQNCTQDVGLLLFITTFSLLSLFILFPILNATFGSELLFLVYMLRAWWHGLLNHKRGRNFEYDAFVSYSSQDQEWVLQHLVYNLEQVGPPFLKLCLHNRDFVVGKAIEENIMDSLYNSRKTICVVSYHALSSYWCSLEMSLATYRLVGEKEDTLILLFMEPVPKCQLSAYHRLAKLVKRKAYLDWPKEPANQLAFWDKLRNRIKEH